MEKIKEIFFTNDYYTPNMIIIDIKKKLELLYLKKAYFAQ